MAWKGNVSPRAPLREFLTEGPNKMATTYHDSQDAVKNNEVLIVAYGSDMHYPDGRSSLHKTFNHSCTQHALPICEHVMSRLCSYLRQQ